MSTNWRAADDDEKSTTRADVAAVTCTPEATSHRFEVRGSGRRAGALKDRDLPRSVPVKERGGREISPQQCGTMRCAGESVALASATA